ncbi:hypothetical protein PIROE2DRAFT_62057 [Piromyces sp. E2]|nr:hypothetical protein PIROE2DRAFT_62057 [Piromyces sp. E2]|eukprot:OUM62168.1 hypothetical protein PIROE2DRAFT_62057 [Piromyces sp. E2]
MSVDDFINDVFNDKLNLDAVDDNDKTAAIYLAENENYEKLEALIKMGANINFVNSRNESVVSILLNKLREYRNLDAFPLKVHKKYTASLNMFEKLVKKYRCNLDVPVDIDDNTAFMALMLIPKLEDVISKVIFFRELAIYP